jgi:subtilase family serine protease
MRRLVMAAAAGSAVLLATFPAAAAPAISLGAVLPLAAHAPESAFGAAAPTDLGTSCARPAPDNRVSTTIHCYTPNQIREFYGLPDLTPSSNEGAGQTIVLVDAYGSPTAVNDVKFFAQTFNGPTPKVETSFPLGSPDYKNVSNGTGQSGSAAAEGWAGEANLDVQWAYAIAPGAHIVLLATPPAETQGVQGLPNLMRAIDGAVAKYPSGTVFSMSFGTDEQAFGGQSAAKSQFARFDQTFIRGRAKGDTFFSSSGDTGTLGVTRSHRASTVGTTKEVSYPNVSPYVTSVGGTQVQSGWTWAPTQDKPFNDDGSRNLAYWNWTAGGHTEAAWNESWAGIGTGGGLSAVYGPQTFQNSVRSVVGAHRGVPDLAWNAAVNGGVLVYHTYFPSYDGPPAWGVFGGTSSSSPQVAALTATANAARKSAGKGPIGDLNKAIYSGSFNKATAFSDIVEQVYGSTPSGDIKNNRMWDTGADGFVTPDPVDGYPTTPGYDLTTGWGSPKAVGYIAQIVAAP